MHRKKEKTLIAYKSGVEDCLCLGILELQVKKFTDRYENLKARMLRAKLEGKNYSGLLKRVQITGNKRKVLLNILSEIRQSYQLSESMIEIRVNGQSLWRLNKMLDYRRSCMGKVNYSRGSSEKAAEEMSEKIGEPMENYKCRHCEFWHVGHTVEI